MQNSGFLKIINRAGFGLFVSLLISLIFASSSFAVTVSRYWVGAAAGCSGLWNDVACWSDTAGGAGGQTVPDSDDNVYFTSDDTAGVVVDNGFDVAVGSLTMQAGYSGTLNFNNFNRPLTTTGALTVSGGTIVFGSGAVSIGSSLSVLLTVNGGTFTGGSGTITTNAFLLSSGVYTATSGTWNHAANFTVSGGTFNHNNGTLVATNIISTTMDVSTSIELYNFEINKIGNSSNDTFALASGDVANVNNVLTFTKGEFNGSGGSKIVSVITTGSVQNWSSGFLAGTGLLQIDNDADFQLPAGANLPVLTMNNAGLDITTAGSVTTTRAFTLTAGTFENTANGDLTFGAFTQSAGTFHASDSLHVGSATKVTYNGIVNLNGGLYDGHNSTEIETNAAITIAGGTFDVIDVDVVDIGSSGSSAFTMTSGSINAPTANIHFNYSFDISEGGTYTDNGGTVNIDGTFNTVMNLNSTFTFTNFILNKTGNTSNDSFSLTTGDVLTVSGILTFTAGEFVGSNTGDKIISSAITGSVQNWSAGFLGGSTFSSLQIDNDADFQLPAGARLPGLIMNNAGLDITTAGDVTAHGGFTLAAGTFENTANGALTFNTTFTQSGGTFNASDSAQLGGASKVTHTGFVMTGGVYNGQASAEVEINNPFSLANGTLNLLDVTLFDLNISFVPSSGSFTAPSGSMTLYGNFDNRNLGSYSNGAGTLTLDSNTNVNVYLTGGTSLQNVTVNLTNNSSNDDFVLQTNVDIDGDFILTDGVLNLGTRTLNVGGDWTIGALGATTVGSSTVQFDGSNQTIYGSATFYNFTKITSSTDTLTFEAGKRQTITNTMTLQGAASNYLSLRSTVTNTQWEIDPQATRTIGYLDVKDSNNVNATAIVTDTFSILTSLGNTNWTFPDPPLAPINLIPASLTNGSSSNDNTPTLSFDITDPDGAATVKYQIQIDDSSDFLSPLVDYISALAAQGTQSFTVGQTAGSGNYYSGDNGQTLADLSYYWKVKAYNNTGVESAYTFANAGLVAFIIDIIAPSVVTQLTPSSPYTTDDKTPTFTWTDLADEASYVLQIASDALFATIVQTLTPVQNAVTIDASSDLSVGTYYWRIYGVDAATNGDAASAVSRSFIIINTLATISSAVMNYNDNVASLAVAGTGFSANCDASKFHLNDISGVDDVTLTGATCNVNTSTQLTITLTEAQRVAALALSGVAGGDGGAVVLDVDAGAIENLDSTGNLEDDNNVVTEVADTNNPAQVLGLTFDSATTVDATISWTAATTDFASYEIYYGIAPAVDNTTGTVWDSSSDANLTTVSTSSTTITGLSEGTTYYFTIYVLDLAGNRSVAAVEISGITSVTPVTATTSPGSTLNLGRLNNPSRTPISDETVSSPVASPVSPAPTSPAVTVPASPVTSPVTSPVIAPTPSFVAPVSPAYDFNPYDYIPFISPVVDSTDIATPVTVVTELDEEVQDLISDYEDAVSEETTSTEDNPDELVISDLIDEALSNDAHLVDLSSEIQDLVLESVSSGSVLNLGFGETVVVDDVNNYQFVFSVGLSEDELAVLRSDAETNGQTLVELNESSDLDSDGVSDLFQLSLGLPLFESDSDNDGFETSEELFFGFSPLEANDIPENPFVTNLDALTVGSNPSIRVMGKAGENVGIYLVNAESQEMTKLSELVVDDRNKGEYSVISPLADGEYYIVLKGDNGYGKISKITVDNQAALDAPELYMEEVSAFSKLMVDGSVRTNLKLGTMVEYVLNLWEKSADASYIAELYKGIYDRQNVVEDVYLVLHGESEPGLIAYVSWKSVLFSSVVLTDASQGRIALELPGDLSVGQHEAIVYVYDRSRGLVSNQSKLFLRKR